MSKKRKHDSRPRFVWTLRMEHNNIAFRVYEEMPAFGVENGGLKKWRYIVGHDLYGPQGPDELVRFANKCKKEINQHKATRPDL